MLKILVIYMKKFKDGMCHSSTAGSYKKKKKLWDAKKIFFFKEFKMNVSMQPF